jgi:two-component system response regulator YesN
MLKVVVVEDEEFVRKGIVLTVDWASVNCAVVAEASNGAEGLETIRRYKPDLIITDIKMPRMDGLEMVDALRQEGNDAYVIILTAYSEFAYAQTAVKLGAVEYLLKPFRDGELEQIIERIQRRERENARQYAPKVCVLNIQDYVQEKSKYVMETLSYLSEHYNDPEISVATIAYSLGVSESHLSHVFKKETSYTLTGYLTSYRMHKAMELLRDCRAKVYEVAEQVGYRDITYFSSAFKKAVGVTPSEYQRQCQ